MSRVTNLPGGFLHSAPAPCLCPSPPPLPPSPRPLPTGPGPALHRAIPWSFPLCPQVWTPPGRASGRWTSGTGWTRATPSWWTSSTRPRACSAWRSPSVTSTSTPTAAFTASRAACPTSPVGTAGPSAGPVGNASARMLGRLATVAPRGSPALLCVLVRSVLQPREGLQDLPGLHQRGRVLGGELRLPAGRDAGSVSGSTGRHGGESDRDVSTA